MKLLRLKILYFASLRERVGTSSEEIALPGPANVAHVMHWLAARGGVWHEVTTLRNLRCAVNHELASADSPLADGDELAFFPPVTGG